MAEQQEYWIEAAAVSRARRMLALFIINWGLMGWLMVILGRENRWLGYGAFALGLVIFLAALSQLRTLRYAGRAPLLILNDEGLAFRYPSSMAQERHPWSSVHGLEVGDDVPGDNARLLRGDEEPLLLPLSSLSSADRASAIEWIERRLASSDSV